MKHQTWVALVAILGIVAVEVVALLHGINGVALSSSVGALGSVAGWFGGQANAARKIDRKPK